MRHFIVAAACAAILAGCTSTSPTVRYPAPFKDPVDIAVNLGLKHAGDLDKLEHAMALEGMPCRRRAMSLNAEQLVVDRGDFDRALALATRIIARDRLTVRVYPSPDFAKTIGAQLQVWEQGKMVREEQYMLY
jgi:hypothetical protein